MQRKTIPLWYYESLYDYPHTKGVRTFSRKELGDLLNDSGYKGLDWYYPLPDYKLPQQVISDDMLPDETDMIWNLFKKGSRNKNIISERRLARTLSKAGLLNEFANSFLVVAKQEELSESTKCVRFIGFNTDKKRKYRTNKKIIQKDNEKLFVLSPDYEEGIEFLHKISKREDLAKKYFSGHAEIVSGVLENDSLVYPYLSFPTMLD